MSNAPLAIRIIRWTVVGILSAALVTNLGLSPHGDHMLAFWFWDIVVIILLNLMIEAEISKNH